MKVVNYPRLGDRVRATASIMRDMILESHGCCTGTVMAARGNRVDGVTRYKVYLDSSQMPGFNERGDGVWLTATQLEILERTEQ